MNSPSVTACIICNTQRPKEKKGKKKKVRFKKGNSDAKSREEGDDPSPIPIAEHVGALLLSERFADVWFRLGRPGRDGGVEGLETVPAHRCVLSARSPVFRALLSGGVGRGENGKWEGSSPDRPIAITDVDPRGFKLLLEVGKGYRLASVTRALGSSEISISAASLFFMLDTE